MAESDSGSRLQDSIKKFHASYTALTAAGKTAFATQIKNQLKTMDDRTRRLYEALIASTKKGLSIDQVIEEMEKADKPEQTN